MAHFLESPALPRLSMYGAAEAGTINTQIKKFAYALTAVVAIALVFDLGQRMRLATFASQLSRPGIISQRSLRDSAYLVSARPSDAHGAENVPGFLPATQLADSSTSDISSSSQQFDDLLNSDSPAATFQQVYLLLKKEYVDNIPDDSLLAHGAASALLTSLGEPNSRFLEASERKSLERQSSGLFTGIGALFTVRKVILPGSLVGQQITIIDPLPGSGAEKAGLKTGDVVTGINGHWVISYDPFAAQVKLFKKLAKDEFDLDKAVNATEKKVTDGYTLAKAQTLLDSAATAPLLLTIQRPGQDKAINVTVDVATPTHVKDVEAKILPNGSGYVVVNTFDGDTAQDFANAVNALGGIKGLILDLRDCSGGELDPAISIAKAVSPNAVFGEVNVRQAAGKSSAASFATRVHPLAPPSAVIPPQINFQGPISVIVNKGTANTAELLAAFLHDKRGARIVGANTFGDGLAQTLFPLSDGSAFTLTTGVLKTDQGQAFNVSGLAPDYVLADAGHAGQYVSGGGDPVVAKAAALLTLGPPKSADIHPLSAPVTPKVASASAGQGMAL